MMFRLYGFLLGLALLVAYEDAVRRAKKYSVTLWKNINLIVPWMLVGGVVGARTYHVVTDWNLYAGQPLWEVFAIWRGGLGIWGGIIGAVVGLLLARLTNISLRGTTHLQWLDLFAGSLPLGQAIGRIGNAVNNELFGTPTTFPWGLNITQNQRPLLYKDSDMFHPLFLY
ncbi:MAG TPA: prolipoprotein diacylglyceryl transferase family protein, partial [Patescibacteria group bacterium]|nr:prolipoprotein diacylglyceryl transferase family protein [Patescibacteria group bacterium]